MSTTLEVPSPEAASPDAVLKDRVPPAFRLPRVVAGFVALVGAIFWLYSYQPLHYTDVWGHLSYGRLICRTGVLPTTEPFMPLAEGMPMVNTVWLSQVGGYLTVAKWGPPGIQFLFAAAVACCFSLMAFGFYRRTRSVAISVMGMAVFESLNCNSLQVARPQIAAIICFGLLLAMLTAKRWRPFFWAAIPALFALWANLHGSFIVGLILLGCAGLGRAIDVWRRTRRLVASFRDLSVRRLVLVTELAAAAVLLNPYGFRLYSEVLSFSGNPNLRDLTEWDALTFRSVDGLIVASVALALAVLYRFSPRRIPAAEVLALVIFGAAALWMNRMLIWWSWIAAGCFVIHVQAAWRRFHPVRKVPGPSPRNGRWTVVTAGLAWIFFAWTPFGLRLLHGNTDNDQRSISDQTPVAAVAWLREHPPTGQLFNICEWGDYLLWAGPENVPVFATSHVHLIPREVWRDYMGIINVAAGWSESLDHYGVQTVIADKLGRGVLIAKLKDDQRWKRVYEDKLAVIFERKTDDSKPADKPAGGGH